MGYHDNSIFKVNQELLQPGDCIQIQVVGRLVQQKDVRVAKQCLCKQNLYLHASVQVLHHAVMIFGINAQTVQQHGGVGFRFPAVHLRELGFQLAGTDAVLVGEVFLCVDGILFLHNVVETLISQNNGVHYHPVVIFEMVLLQYGETLTGCDYNITLGSFQFAGQNL